MRRSGRLCWSLLVWIAILTPLGVAHAQTQGGVIPVPYYVVTVGTEIMEYGGVPRPAVSSLAACERQRAVLYRNAKDQLSVLLNGRRFGLTLRLRCQYGGQETVYVQAPGLRYTVAP